MEDTIYLTDEEGNEHRAQIILTFEYEDRNYVLLREEGDESVYAFTYDDEGNMYAVETEEELEYCEEVLDAFVDEAGEVDGEA